MSESNHGIGLYSDVTQDKAFTLTVDGGQYIGKENAGDIQSGPQNNGEDPIRLSEEATVQGELAGV